MKYHKPEIDLDLPNQRELRIIFTSAKKPPSFPHACDLLSPVLGEFFDFSFIDFSQNVFNDWKSAIDTFINTDYLPIAISTRVHNNGAHIRAVLGYNSGTLKFTIYDPADGSINDHDQQDLVNDFNRSFSHPLTGQLIGPCRDILIIKPK